MIVVVTQVVFKLLPRLSRSGARAALNDHKCCAKTVAGLDRQIFTAALQIDLSMSALTP
jgi:hypothetical protein